MDRNQLTDNTQVITDVVTYPGLNSDERYIHCSIGGIRQLAKKLSDEDNERLSAVVNRVRETKDWSESRSFRLSLAEKYYKAEIISAAQGQDQVRAFKR